MTGPNSKNDKKRKRVEDSDEEHGRRSRLTVGRRSSRFTRTKFMVLAVVALVAATPPDVNLLSAAPANPRATSCLPPPSEVNRLAVLR